MSDKDGGKFAMQLMADAYKAKGDTAAWIKSLEEGILKFPGNDYFFANLVDYYNTSNQASKAAVKKFYEEAKPFYEKARALKPDQKDLWLQGLYRVYYNLNMGPEFEEIDKMMK